ncbi:5-methylcytosine-specific restriction endonuclease subunit McrB [Acetobacterium woodii]|uniref:5-methylcytosine-specific restriction enzyme McrB n=1 Tax=Acetobacterium woodii (strain ATCC 29683 / DSM 1030 / JCM 2381 / KCTC 1655 / WB1) TaxID=931626 RepID=H6LED3_ACEWD|nr:5-methylcytosine-specific restriction enzyme McrB [Acetobacterium woodii]AFA46847.1 5-methylcytosine-specific restriction enzyme McrB [Acetobacterium woodii DSM 1030]
MDNRPSWFVSEFSDGGNQQPSCFIKAGFWENVHSDKSSDLINEMKVGDRIALKATHNKKNNIPFNTNGKLASVMEIKAVGIIKKNDYNGKKIDVCWTKFDTVKEWYFFTFIRSIWKIEANPKNWMSQELIEFTFNNKPQDIKRFLKEPYWKKRFMKEILYADEIVMVLKQLGGEAHLSDIQDEIMKRKKITNIEKNPNWRAEIRFTLQKLSSDSKSFAKGDDLFYRKSFSSEIWGLREKVKKKVAAYSKRAFLADVFMSAEKYDVMVGFLKIQKSIIIQGDPGVWKSYFAKRLAYSLLKEKDESSVLLFELNNWIGEKNFADHNQRASDLMVEQCGFIEFCQKAVNDPHHDFYFIISEIKRANINQIMVDLLFLFKRNNDSKKFQKIKAEPMRTCYLPQNLYIIGMMAASDQWISVIDQKLKQQFPIIEIESVFDSSKNSKNE